MRAYPDRVEVFSKYGAPMGRRDSHPGNEPEARVRVYRVRFVDGDYDRGGAYWGGGTPLYCATDDMGFVRWIRASDRAAAKAIVREEFPEARLAP